MQKIETFEIMPAFAANTMPNKKFDLGSVQATALCKHFEGEEAWTALCRHSQGDWGDISDGEKAKNDAAINTNGALISCYRIRNMNLFLVTLPKRDVTVFATSVDMVMIIAKMQEVNEEKAAAEEKAPAKEMMN